MSLLIWKKDEMHIMTDILETVKKAVGAAGFRTIGVSADQHSERRLAGSFWK